MSRTCTGVAAHGQTAPDAGDGLVPPLVIAHAPSPLFRVLHDLDAELRAGTLRHENVTTLCDRLLQNLLQHFQSDELTTVLPDLERTEPSSQAEAERCIDQRQQMIARATQLVQRSRQETRDLRWRRQLSRELTMLHNGINAQQRQELELVRQAYRLDVKESD
jgi:hypothetical protein